LMGFSQITDNDRKAVLVFSGGLGLAAYHAGVYQAFSERGLPLYWVSGSSAGAVTAALLAGNVAEARLERLRAFWNAPPTGSFAPDPGRHLYRWLGAVKTRVLGSPGHFYPRLPSMMTFGFRSLYDLAPMKDRLARLIDFGRLNSGAVRIWVTATDLESGEPVTFDSSVTRIEMEHLLASCGFLPEFAPVEIDGRMLGDGGLSLNAPFDPVLNSHHADNLLVYISDLYARDGARPDSLEAAAERKNDLMFGNQTLTRLSYCLEARKLRRQLDGWPVESRGDRVVVLSYRPGLEEAGPEKSFDLSAAALAQRWNAGYLDMKRAEQVDQDTDSLTIRRPSPHQAKPTRPKVINAME